MAELHAGCFDEPWTEHAFYQLINLPTTVGWINEMGFVLCSHVLDEMEIMTICTHPDYRRQGLGQSLLSQIEKYAKLANVCNIFLEVRDDNTPAQNLYLKNGYIKTGLRKGYYKTKSGPVDAVCMMKEISKNVP